MSKEIPLSKRGQNRGKYVAIVDDADFGWVSQFNWHIQSAGYAARTITVDGRETLALMHRDIAMHMGFPEDAKVDHKNHDQLDNRRSNLRPATNSQNSANHKRPITSKSGYLGLKLDKRNNKWRAVVSYLGKKIQAGYSMDATEAARLRDAKAKEIYGEFATLNFPDEAQP